ncbi:MAG TPA: (d)CMP kinase [Anaerolineae bacterium]|nr:(d)CMP kinase [Anaerolineae bacterium]
MDKGKKIKAIAIDGPAGSGKSTIAKLLANELGYLFFDTGGMYRAVTWEALCRNIPIDDQARVTSLAENVQIDVRAPTVDDGRSSDVLADGKDITWDIRRPEVDENVSIVSAYPGVRKALTAQQRRIGLRGNVVMAGRDIGTVVLPDAELKIYLDASVEERARRRFLERQSRGEMVDFDEILEMMHRRDSIDSTREVAPLCAAEDAVVIDTERKSISQILDYIMSLVNTSLVV